MERYQPKETNSRRSTEFTVNGETRYVTVRRMNLTQDYQASPDNQGDCYGNNRQEKQTNIARNGDQPQTMTNLNVDTKSTANTNHFSSPPMNVQLSSPLSPRSELNNNVTRHVKFVQHESSEGQDPGAYRLHKLFADQPQFPFLVRSLERLTLDGATYSWSPTTTDSTTVRTYMSMLPPEKRPFEKSDGDAERRRQLQRQLPMYDLDPTLCDSPTAYELKKHGEFLHKVKAIVAGIGEVNAITTSNEWVCRKCQQYLVKGEVGVFVHKTNLSMCWHPACFCCTTCKHILADLIFFHKDGNIYCGRHYAQRVRPRCSACDELIFSKEYTQAEGQNWHVKHFCCWRCDRPLAGKDYMPFDRKPYCIRCYQSNFGSNCRTCYTKIAPNCQRISLEDYHWHARPECFKCSSCHKDLLNQKIVPKDGMIFCSVDCRSRILSEPVSPRCVRLPSDSSFSND